MSTRSRIGMEMPDGSIKSIYCHWDGYPEGVGATLEKHYKDPKKIEKLLELGDISSLGEFYNEELSNMDWHKFDDPEKRDEILKKTEKCTVAYKDRGENVPARIDKNEAEFISRVGACCEDYTYLYKEDYDGVYRWFYLETPYFTPISDRLEKAKNVSLSESDMLNTIVDKIDNNDGSFSFN